MFSADPRLCGAGSRCPGVGGGVGWGADPSVKELREHSAAGYQPGEVRGHPAACPGSQAGPRAGEGSCREPWHMCGSTGVRSRWFRGQELSVEPEVWLLAFSCTCVCSGAGDKPLCPSELQYCHLSNGGGRGRLTPLDAARQLAAPTPRDTVHSPPRLSSPAPGPASLSLCHSGPHRSPAHSPECPPFWPFSPQTAHTRPISGLFHPSPQAPC